MLSVADQLWSCQISHVFMTYNVENSGMTLTQAYIIHNATLPLSDITGGGLSGDMQLPLESQKTLYYDSHGCSFTL